MGAGRIQTLAGLAAAASVALAACGPKAGPATSDRVAGFAEADAAARSYLESVPEIADDIGKLVGATLVSDAIFSARTADGDALILVYELTGARGTGRAKVWLLRGEVAWSAVGARARVKAKTIRAGRELELGAGDADSGLD